VSYPTFGRFLNIAAMDILLTPPPGEKWIQLPRQGLYRRPSERLRGLSRHVLLDLWRDGLITIIQVNRADSSRPIRLVDLQSLDKYLESLAIKQALWRGVPMPEEVASK
jgi:hypothetical protein